MRVTNIIVQTPDGIEKVPEEAFSHPGDVANCLEQVIEGFPDYKTMVVIVRRAE